MGRLQEETRRGALKGDASGRLRPLATTVLGATAAISLAAGLAVGDGSLAGPERVAAQFTLAWQRSDYGAMYELLDEDARRRISPTELQRAYESAALTATATSVRAGEAEQQDDEVAVPLAVQTNAFGTVTGTLRLPIEGDPLSLVEPRIAWAPNLVFPGMPMSTTLHRETEPPPRADILAVDGAVLAGGQGDARRAESAGRIAGDLGPAGSRTERGALYALGFPRSMPVGLTGLERALQPLVAGKPGGRLLAGERLLAASEPRPAPALRTTIDADTQRAAMDALGGRPGGIAALDARTAEVRALAGAAVASARPPGSTFKIVTATAALEAGVRLDSRFPARTLEEVEKANVDGVQSEDCGGTFTAGFAESCNSLFAALGLDVGAERLVATAERYGFNQPPQVPGAAPSTLPPAEEVGGSGFSGKQRDRGRVGLAETAIGQGQVRATPLELASLAQTVAAGGVRTAPRLLPAAPSRSARVSSPEVARSLERLMVDVVASGTAQQAALSTGQVAGKTGTAVVDRAGDGPVLAETDTDAWFTAYAPVSEPKLAVAVGLRQAGSGGEDAAPAAGELLELAASGR